MHVRDVEDVHHVGHLIASLLTCGLWLPFWLFIAFMAVTGPWVCSQCGNSRKA